MDKSTYEVRLANWTWGPPHSRTDVLSVYPVFLRSLPPDFFKQFTRLRINEQPIIPERLHIFLKGTSIHVDDLFFLTIVSPQRPCKQLMSRSIPYFPNSSAVFTMRSATFTPNGHRLSHPWQPMQADAVVPSAR